MTGIVTTSGEVPYQAGCRCLSEQFSTVHLIMCTDPDVQQPRISLFFLLFWSCYHEKYLPFIYRYSLAMHRTPNVDLAFLKDVGFFLVQEWPRVWAAV